MKSSMPGARAAAATPVIAYSSLSLADSTTLR